MIHLKNSAQITAMKDAGRITGEALLVARDMVRPGISTYEIDEAIRRYIEKCGAKPAFLGYGGFPASACISINDEVIHGIPSKNRILKEGDIVKIDTGATYRGYVGDSARTIPVGNVSETARKLMEVTRNSFWAGVDALQVGNRLPLFFQIGIVHNPAVKLLFNQPKDGFVNFRFGDIPPFHPFFQVGQGLVPKPAINPRAHRNRARLHFVYAAKPLQIVHRAAVRVYNARKTMLVA